MADSDTSPSSAPLYHEVDPKVTLALRIYGAVTAFLVFQIMTMSVSADNKDAITLALIFCFVKGAEDANMYLLAVNMILSSLIGAVLAWWYRKGIIEADKIGFLVLLGICIMFQAIVSDIYVYHRQASASKLAPANPHINTTAGTVSPITKPPSMI